jgi:hypothetical protein
MRSPDQLRAEVYRLLDDAKRSPDTTVKQTLAARACELAQQAEAIAGFPNDTEGLRLKVAQYGHMRAGADSEPKQRAVAQLLRDAEDKLQRVSSQQRPPRRRWVAAAWG